MGQKAGNVRFRYTIGMSQQYFGDTISFASMVGPSTILAPFYEKVVIGFSMAGNSGLFGFRWFWNNPAAPISLASPGTNAVQLNPTATAAGVAGVTGVGASVGVFTWRPAEFGQAIAGLTCAFFGNAFPTPTILEISRVGGVSQSGTVVISGVLWNPIK